MWIFNITFHPDDSVRQALLDYLRTRLIPVLTSENMLQSPVLMEIHMLDAPGFALQFDVKDEAVLNEFMEKYWPGYRKAIWARFGESVPFFITRMKKISAK